MTITISKTKLAIAVFAIAMIAPATALATHVFDDVDDTKFYADPVEWAFDNGITTGKSPTSFAPDDGVTRGESVTFLKRYNDNVVEPSLDANSAEIAANTAAIGANNADIEALPEMLWATVAPADDTAVIVRGSGAESVAKTGTGYFSVTFDRDVSECTWVATYGEPDNSGVNAAYATVRGGPTSQEARVVLRDSGGAQVDGDGFHLMVVCDPEGPPVLVLDSAPAPSVDPNVVGE